MTAEDQLKHLIGELHFRIALLTAKVEELQKQVKPKDVNDGA